MSVVAENARIFGSDSDAIYLAPIGTTLPTSIDEALDGAFEDVGWLHSDGITEALTGSKSVIRGYQGGGVVRTLMADSGTTVRFNALESKPLTKQLRYHEKAVTVNGGVREVTRGAGQRVTAMSAVIDVFDADDVTIKERHVISRLEIVPNGDRVFVSSDISGFPFEGEIIGDYTSFEGSNVTTSLKWALTLDGTPSGGTFILAVNGVKTAPIAYNATANTIAAAINALSGVTGITGVTATGSTDITFPTKVGLAVDGSALTGGTNPSASVAPTV